MSASDNGDLFIDTVSDCRDQQLHVITVVGQDGSCQGANEDAVLGVRLFDDHVIPYVQPVAIVGPLFKKGLVPRSTAIPEMIK